MLKYAVVALVPFDGGYIGVSRKDNPNDFGLIGGKVDDGENYIDAIKREITEETGLNIDIKDTDLLYSNMDGEYFVLTFKGSLVGEFKPQTNEKGVVNVVSQKELLNGSFGEYNKGLFEFLEINNIEVWYDR